MSKWLVRWPLIVDSINVLKMDVWTIIVNLVPSTVLMNGCY